MNSQETIGVKQAAKILGVHENTIRNYAKAGVVPTSLSAQGYHRFLLEDLQVIAAKTPAKNLLSPAEAAEILKVHRNTISNLRARKVLNGYKLPGSNYYRYRRKDIDKLKKSMPNLS